MAQRKKRVKPAPVITGGEPIPALAIVEGQTIGKNGVNGNEVTDGATHIDADVTMADVSEAAVGQEEVLAGSNGVKSVPEAQEVGKDDAMAMDSDHDDDALVEDAI